MIITVKNLETIKKSKTVYLLDFANIIYILSNHFGGNRNKVINAFHLFLCKLYSINCTVIIVAKKTVDISLVEILNYDKQHLKLFQKFLQSKRLIIYDLQYPVAISSSVDDLIFNLIMVDIYSNFPLKPLHLVTNDKQKLNKNLFGISKNENYNELRIMTVAHTDENTFVYVNDKSLQKIRNLLNNLVLTGLKDTKGLNKCIFQLIRLFYKNEKVNNGSVTYKNISTLYNKSNAAKRSCRNRNHTAKNKLSYVNYLYSYIKHIQIINSGNFYGSMSSNDIIRLITDV